MTLDPHLQQRCQSACELCAASTPLSSFEVTPSDGSADQSAALCATCISQLSGQSDLNINHWRCLNDSMWSQTPAIQVLAWRQLNQLAGLGEIWAQDLLEMLYLDEPTLAWANALQSSDEGDPTLDSNGTTLQSGDTVTLIKDLDVKGAGFTAKRGTSVKNITLTSNPEQVEGRVNGTRIVLLSKFLKKAN